MPRRPNVAVLNLSTVVSDSEVVAATAAIQHQVDHDFEPAWGAGCSLHSYAALSEVPAHAWQLVVLDDADQAGALGYHDLTADLRPLGKIFAKTTKDDGAEWTVTYSHELLEMLADPHINLCALDPATDRLYAYESADAVEADEFGYPIDGVLVSDFVFPVWFDPEARNKAGLIFDHGRHVAKPFTLAKGGYISWLSILHPSAGWQQSTAQEAAKGAREPGFPPGSRRERRARLHRLKASEPRLK